MTQSYWQRRHYIQRTAKPTANWMSPGKVRSLTIHTHLFTLASHSTANSPTETTTSRRKLIDTTLNETCRIIRGCTRPTVTPDLYVLSGIAPPEIRRRIHSQNELTKQLTDQRHSLHHHQPVKSRIHSRNSFVSTSQPLLCKPAEAHVAKWQKHWEATHSNLKKYYIDIHQK